MDSRKPYVYVCLFSMYLNIMSNCSMIEYTSFVPATLGGPWGWDPPYLGLSMHLKGYIWLEAHPPLLILGLDPPFKNCWIRTCL